MRQFPERFEPLVNLLPRLRLGSGMA